MIGQRALVPAHHWASTQRRTYDEATVRQARQLLRQLRDDPPDVVYLGDSVALWMGDDDGDPRDLITMLRDELGSDVSVFLLSGPGFSAHLHHAFLHLLDGVPHPPVMLHTLWARGSMPSWIVHPEYGHQRAMRKIESVNPATRALWRVRMRREEKTPDAWAAHHRLPYPTVNRPDAKVGDFAPLIRDRSRWADDDPERLALLHEYHYGMSVAGAIGLENYARLGERIRTLGCPDVAYETPVPIDAIRQLLGERFVDLAAENIRLLNEAYLRGAGTNVEIVEAGMIAREGDHLPDGSEHLSGSGRRKLVDMVVPAIHRALERRG